MSQCSVCGVGSRGAFIIEYEGADYCVECHPENLCERCGEETDNTTLAGDFLCKPCQGKRHSEDTTREAGQAGLDGGWS